MRKELFFSFGTYTTSEWAFFQRVNTNQGEQGDACSVMSHLLIPELLFVYDVIRLYQVCLPQ